MTTTTIGLLLMTPLVWLIITVLYVLVFEDIATAPWVAFIFALSIWGAYFLLS